MDYFLKYGQYQPETLVIAKAFDIEDMLTNLIEYIGRNTTINKYLDVETNFEAGICTFFDKELNEEIDNNLEEKDISLLSSLLSEEQAEDLSKMSENFDIEKYSLLMKVSE